MASITDQYDVVVVGAGHAGCEAAVAAARLGARTALITTNLAKVAALPCNPSVGGPGKGHIVREIDALGGIMARVVDDSAIQIKELNTSKGPAVRAYRAQLDRARYNQNMIEILQSTEGLELIEDGVSGVEAKNGKVVGVTTTDGELIRTKTVIVCSGTFLNGEIIVGPKVIKKGGRIDESSVSGLSQSLQKLGLKSGRLKTGTPPRIRRSSIDYSKLEEAPGMGGKISFSHPTRELLPLDKQVLCWLTYTNQVTHQLILDNYHLSGNISGLITETGPRSCPSIDLKVKNFPDRERHPIFIEPVGTEDGPDGELMYLQGCSTAFSPELQEKIFRSIKGLEKAEFIEYGYAVRYDFFPPHQLTRSLSTKVVQGLYLAGQMNGTTGYEEAAAQGLIAGINAARLAKNLEPFVLDRTESYIGVLIEDLVTKTHAEPYRMFTSRAEYRLLLRNDNTSERLTQKGYEIGLVDNATLNRAKARQQLIRRQIDNLKKQKIKYAGKSSTANSTSTTAYQLLKRPEINYQILKSKYGINLPEDVASSVEIEIKYEGYFERQKRDAEKLQQWRAFVLSDEIDYDTITGIRNEARARLKETRPESIAQAMQIQGITPADLNMLMVSAHAHSKAIE